MEPAMFLDAVKPRNSESREKTRQWAEACLANASSKGDDLRHEAVKLLKARLSNEEWRLLTWHFCGYVPDEESA